MEWLRAGLPPLLVLAGGCASGRTVAPHGDRDGETGPGAPPARFAPLGDQGTWDRLPRATPPLPVWARTLADSLPGTTAFQVDLDFLHRTKNPLGPVLGGKLRWVVSDALRCPYAKESVEADLARAGLTAQEVQRLAGPAGAAEPERTALEFARRLTLDGSSITDAEVAGLIAAFGPDDAVAIVHTVAHANFQDRIFLALGLTAEPGGPLPPREVRPSADAKFTAPERPPSGDGSGAADAGMDGLPPWSRKTIDELRERVERQKALPPRIPDPDPVRLARLPRPDRARVGRVAWGTVSMGYQPVLTSAWFRTMAAYDDEAKLDEVLANTVFWVVTRTNDCFY